MNVLDDRYLKAREFITSLGVLNRTQDYAYCGVFGFSREELNEITSGWSERMISNFNVRFCDVVLVDIAIAIKNVNKLKQSENELDIDYMAEYIIDTFDMKNNIMIFINEDLIDLEIAKTIENDAYKEKDPSMATFDALTAIKIKVLKTAIELLITKYFKLIYIINSNTKEVSFFTRDLFKKETHHVFINMSMRTKLELKDICDLNEVWSDDLNKIQDLSMPDYNTSMTFEENIEYLENWVDTKINIPGVVGIIIDKMLCSNMLYNENDFDENYKKAQGCGRIYGVSNMSLLSYYNLFRIKMILLLYSLNKPIFTLIEDDDGRTRLITVYH